MAETIEFQKQIGRIEGLVKQLESAADPALKSAAQELMRALMQLHGAGLERIIELINSADSSGATMRTLAGEALIGSLLILYGLHPDDFETRVERALEQVRLLCRRDGAHVDEVIIEPTAVRLRIAGGGSQNLEAAIRGVILEVAPDASEIAITGLELAGAAGFVPLTSIVSAAQS